MSNKTNAIIAIIEKNKSKHIYDTFLTYGALPYLQLMANGTASSELLDMLGFGSNKREIIISLCNEDNCSFLMNQLKSREHIKLHTKGIIFSVPLNALSSLLNKNVNNFNNQIEKGDNTMTTASTSLILVAINHGHVEEVMATAKKNGAKGGTVFRANFNDNDYIESLYNVSLQQDKEILAIVANDNIKKNIIDNIHSQHGLNSKAQAMIISLPVIDKTIL